MAQESKTPAPFRTSIGGQALIEGILMRGAEPAGHRLPQERRYARLPR